MVKNPTKPAGFHEHCSKCYDIHCQTSCLVIRCEKNCGAFFHSCKQEEHQLLCPNETTPCLNAEYGCPLTMTRHQLSKHLEFCPASLVCCFQEWNRWPFPETDLSFYRNVSENLQENAEVDVDVAMALRDQTRLFEAIKMRDIFPELMEKPDVEDVSAGVSGSSSTLGVSHSSDSELIENGLAKMDQNEQSQDVSEDVSAGISGSTLGVSRSSDSELVENGFAKMEQSEQSQEEIDALVKSRDMEGISRPSEICEIFPKLMEEDVSGSTVGVSRELIENDFAKMEQNEQSQEEIDALVKSRDMGRIQNYSNWEKIFRKEKMGCNQTVKNLNNERGVEQNEVQTLAARKEENRDFKQEGESSANANTNANANANARNEGGATGLAPWQDGVLERLGKEFNIGEYNMYLVHNGAMLINFGQLAACTPREKDFVYGNLEPIEVKTVHTFNVPTSYRAKRSHLKDPMSKAATKHQGVDTSDLGLTLEDIPKSDEVISTLLCSLEKEFKGHVISQSTWTDGIYVDVGTQTYNFPSAPFKEGASLADVVASKPRGLYIQIEAEPVTRRHNRNSSAFNFTCGHFFRRDEFRSHFSNAHSEIQAWFLQRCPLAYLGCTFSQTRFNPSGQQANIKFCPDTDSLSLVPSTYQGTVDPNIDTFSNLPFEVLQLVASYLDSFTLSQMSQVSHRMREVCATFLQERGMVSLQWRKKTYSHGGSSWKCWKKVWSFSTLFSPVERWRIGDISSMSNHLKTCSFYQKEEHSRPVALACLQEVRDRFAESNLKR